MNIKKLLCIFGHNPEDYITEDETWICTSRCKICHAPLGMPYFKKKDLPPPRSNAEQIKDWEKYCDERENKVRNSIKKQ